VDVSFQPDWSSEDLKRRQVTQDRAADAHLQEAVEAHQRLLLPASVVSGLGSSVFSLIRKNFIGFDVRRSFNRV